MQTVQKSRLTSDPQQSPPSHKGKPVPGPITPCKMHIALLFISSQNPSPIQSFRPPMSVQSWTICKEGRLIKVFGIDFFGRNYCCESCHKSSPTNQFYIDMRRKSMKFLLDIQYGSGHACHGKIHSIQTFSPSGQTYLCYYSVRFLQIRIKTVRFLQKKNRC